MEQPSITKRAEQTVGVVGLSILMILVIIFLAIRPQLTKLREQNINLAAKQAELKKKQAKLDNLKQLESEINQARDTINKLTIVLPSGKGVEELLVQMETIAVNSGVQLASFTPAAEELKAKVGEGETTETAAVKSAGALAEGIQSLSFSVALLGDYSSLKKFLQSLETNLRPIKIKAINLAAGVEVNLDNPSISANLQMETFYQTSQRE